MFAIKNKTNNGKLIAALAVLAMVVCAFAAFIPAVDAVDDETYGGTYAADPALKGELSVLNGVAYVSLLESDGTEYSYLNGNTEAITNSTLGNTNLSIAKTNENTITISGTLAMQSADSQFEMTDGNRDSYDYGFMFNLTGPATDGEYGFGSTDNPVYISYYNSDNTWKVLTKTGSGSTQLVYVDDARESTTYYITSGEEATAPADENAAKADANTVALTVNFNFTMAGIVEDASELQDVLDAGATDVNVTGGTLPTTVTLSDNQNVTLGANVIVPENTTFTVPEDSTISFTNPMNATDEPATFKVTGGTASTATATFSDVTGNLTITGGSIIVSGSWTGAIELETGDVIIPGTVNRDITISGTDGTVIFQNTSITSNATVTLGSEITYTVEGDMKVYGKIVSSTPDATTPISIDVPAEQSFTAYSGATIGKGVVVNGAGDISLGSAMSNVTINDDVESDIIWSQSQQITIAETMTIKSGYTMTVLGELIINEGVTVYIEENAHLVVGQAADVGNNVPAILATGVTVNGTIVVEESGEFSVDNAQNVAVSGSIQSEGAVTINSKVTVNNGGSIEIMEANNSSITVTKDLTIEVGGELSVSAKMTVSADGISNKGTVILNNAILTGGTVYINQNADGAVVDIRSVIAAADAVSPVLRVQDNDLVFETDRQGNAIAGQTVVNDDSNAVHIILSANVGIRGLMVTESVVSVKDGDDTLYSNSMILSGGVSVESELSDAQSVNIDLRGEGRTAGGAGGLYVNADQSLTLGSGVSMDLVNGNMHVDGNMTATATGSAITTATDTDMYVSGIITVLSSGDTDIEPGMNAFHYQGTDANAYHYYTTLAASIANGATAIDFMGEVDVMENVTIPANTRVTGETGAKMTIGDGDNRDVTVTVADSASIRNGTVEVMGTLVFENDNRDNRTTVQSDVMIDEDPRVTYTNIYTALDNAESGEVTIYRTNEQGAVVLDKDIEVKAGVTLVIPDNSTVTLYDGVTLTVNGTVENSGVINNVKDETGAAGATFNPVNNDGKTNTDAAKIVVNGAFKSLEYTYYNNAPEGETNYYIPGAYYQIIDTEGSWYWITPVEQAAGVAATVTEDGIDIFGDITVGDVAFTGGEDGVTVTVTAEAELTAGTITLTDAILDVDGAFTGAVANAVGSVSAVNAKDFTVQDTADEDDVVYLYLNGTPVAADGTLDSAVIVATGKVNAGTGLDITADLDDFSIASGATLEVSGDGDLGVNDLTVDGTLVVTDGGNVTATNMTVRGTLTVVAETEDIAASTVSISGNLYIGIAVDEDDPYKYVDSSAAAVTADDLGEVQSIYVSAESTFTGELADGMDSTEFYVEDALWMTVYVSSNTGFFYGTGSSTYNFQPGDLASSKFVQWNDADGEKITTGYIGDDNRLQVYAEIDYNVYKVAITLDNTVGSVAIDGQMLIYKGGVYVLPGVDNYLTAGEHTISYTLAANYEGTPTLSSQNVTVSGMTFTLSGDFEDEDGPITYYLSLGGATLADQTVVIEGGNGGNGELGLTDYLLIILVILIVVMAIIVAMRLMRS